jgi:guanine deaminase
VTVDAQKVERARGPVMTNAEDAEFMQTAIELARSGMRQNEGGPFGAIVVKGNAVIGRGNNRVLCTNDPTAHAEIVAIREACRFLQSFQLEGCTMYASCEPCPMCLGAIYWARLSKVFYGCTKKDAAQAGFDDELIYNELQIPARERRIPMESISRDVALRVFVEWEEKRDKTRY